MTLLQSINPATGAVLWEGPSADASAVDAAIARARAAFAGWSRLPLAERIAIAERYKSVLESRREQLIAAISDETGKPRWDAAGEVTAMIGKIAISIQAYHERTGAKQLAAVAGATPALHHRPHGVVAVYGPYNFPAHLPNGHIVPALIAGNTVVFKPSELTPMVGALMADCWAEAGLPEGVLNVVQGAKDTGIALAGHDGIDGLFFTGSAATGIALHKQLAGQPQKILALELGGNNPLLVHQSTNPATVAYHIIQSAFLSAGQRCTCARRLILWNDAEGDAILEAVLALTRTIRVGAPTETPEPFIGPVISALAAGQLLAAQERMLEQGARALLPMASLPLGPAYVSPAVLDVTHQTDRADVEHFGPLLQVIRVADTEGAIAEANRTGYGLAAALFTENDALWQEIAPRLRAGIINRNRQTTGASSAAPFGGIGLSGNHRPSAYYAADYCAYPVAGMEAPTLEAPTQKSPGLEG